MEMNRNGKSMRNFEPDIMTQDCSIGALLNCFSVSRGTEQFMNRTSSTFAGVTFLKSSANPRGANFRPYGENWVSGTKGTRKILPK